MNCKNQWTFHRQVLNIVIVDILFLCLPNCNLNAQGILGGILKKVNIALKSPSINKTNKTGGDKSVSADIIQDEKDNYRTVKLTPSDITRYYRIAGDFYIDVADTKSKYPVGYEPKWSMMGNFFQMPFTRTNFMQNKLTGTGTQGLAIGEVNGKAYIYLSGFLSCNCMAPLLKNGDQIVIDNSVQSFFVNDFVQTGSDGQPTSNPCKNMNMSFYDTGGWKMKLSLSIDDQQILFANAQVESLTTQKNFINRNGMNVSSIWVSENISLPNLMTVAKAIEDIKQKQKDAAEVETRRIAQEKRHKEEIIAFEAEIKNSFRKVAIKQNNYPEFIEGCIKTSNYTKFVPGTAEVYHYITETTGRTDEQGLPVFEQHKVVDQPETMGGYIQYIGVKNNCDKTIVIKGITKLESESNTIYFKDASIKLGPGETIDHALVIDGYYNSKTAEIGSTHYFKRKVSIK